MNSKKYIRDLAEDQVPRRLKNENNLKHEKYDMDSITGCDYIAIPKSYFSLDNLSLISESNIILLRRYLGLYTKLRIVFNPSQWNKSALIALLAAEI